MDRTEGQVESPPTLVIRWPWTVGGLTAMWTAIFATPVVDLTGSTESNWERPLGSFLAVIGLVVGVRTARSCLRVDGSGITIRNTWRTRSWSWEEVAEVGWDSPAWNRFAGPLHALSICALGDPFTYTASGTTGGPKQLDEHAAVLGPVLAAHGVTDRILDEVATTHRWWSDPRSQSGAQ